MLVLHSTSRCDVCLLEYTWENSAKVPHAIACGHIFCRDCLYATTPPICPLCRRQYQPGKIKRLHVDRPENVDEAREDEMRRQQLDLLEKLVEVWDIELKAPELPASRPTRNSLDNRPEPGSRSGSHDAIIPTHSGIQVEEDSEDDVAELPATSRDQRRVRILASAQMVGDASDDDEPQGQSEDEEFHEFPAEGLHEDDNPGVEEILDGIAGQQGVGRRFLDRWGPGLGEAGPVVSVREVQRRYMGEILRQVDVWLEGQDMDTCSALRKNRLFFTQHLAVRMALDEALDAARLLTEDRKKLTEDKEELERIKAEERKTAREELERYVRYVEQLTKQNQDLKSRLSSQQQEARALNERPPLLSNRSTPAIRNPLPPPPQPVSTQHLPSFLQAVSETSGSVAGSAYANSHYTPSQYTPSQYTPSHYTPSMAGSSSMGVRFADLAPGSPPRAKERYGGLENGESPHGSPRGRSSKKKSRSKDPPSAYSYTYRDTPGYFDENNHHRQTSSTSTVNPSYPTSPTYPNSAPAVAGGFAPTRAAPSSYGSGPSIHSARPSTSVLPSNGGQALPYYHASSQPASPYSSQPPSNGAHTPNRAYATRSAGLQTRFEDTSQPLDAFSLTSAYLREFSSGFVNGQEAALGLGRFAPPPAPQAATPARSSRLNHHRADTSDSLIFTNESAEDGGGLLEEDEESSGSRSSSRSHTGSQPLSSINYPALGSILGSHAPRTQMGSVPLPPSSQGHSSPAVSYLSGPRSLLNRQNSDGASGVNALGLNTSRSGPPSSVSSVFSAPPSLPEDPAAAAAAITQSLNPERYERGGRRSPTRSHSSWGTVNSNAQSNSLISGLVGLRVEDNVSVRTRGTRETRFSLTSFGSFASGADGNGGLGSVDESGERHGATDSRRNSRGSELGNGLPSPYIGGDSSPARPIGSMVGVLPLEEQDSDTSPYQQRTGSSTTTLPATSGRPAPYLDDTLRSATAMDRRMPSNSTITPRSAGHSAHSQAQSLSNRPSRSDLRPTEAQRIAASVGWNSSSSSLNLGLASVSGYYTEVERSPAISRRRNNRHREETSHREERVDRRNHELPALPAHRSQTSMGVAPSNGSASGWMWDSDSNSYPSPFSHASQNNDRGFSQLPSTASHPRIAQPSTTTRINPAPYSTRPHRERERERASHHQSDYSTSQTHAPTRPSLLSSESTSPFPVTVESTDDERFSRETRAPSHAHSSTQSSSGGGRTTRTAGYSTSASATLSSGSRTEDTSPNPPLQSFGNALGLDLLTTSGEISAPTPVTTSSTQRFLRSFSYDE